jgi:hypothetical protein
MQRRRVLSVGGDAVYVEILWDDPMQVEQPDESVIATDPDATWLIHEVFYQNIYEPPTDFKVSLRHRLNPMSWIIEPNTPEESRVFNPGTRPDMRDLTAITLGSSGAIGGGLAAVAKVASPQLFATFVPSLHFRFKRRRR